MATPTLTSSESILELSRQHIAGGVVSLNRKTSPPIVFVKAQGSHLWDADGNRYIDYHAAFAPHLLGHNHPAINAAVRKAMEDGWSLMGSGTTPWEAELAALVCAAVPSLERVQILNTGSEGTANAIRLARAFTGRDDIVTTLGGYNGWHDEVGRAVMPGLKEIGPRISPGEYPFLPISAGIPVSTQRRIHIINFNDLASLEYVFQNHSIACFISEPVLQNIGVVLPNAGYLQGVRALCDKYNVVWIMDEVKTGFRSALGGYQSIAQVVPDLTVFGKAVANGFPLSVLGGKASIMNLLDSPDPAKRVLVAGTYNGHPINVAASLATLALLQDPSVYEKLERQAARLQEGIEKAFSARGIPVCVGRNGSALCPYFTSRPPTDWHDVLESHNFALDRSFRQLLIKQGIYVFPLPCKQISIGLAHTKDDIEATLAAIDKAAKNARP